NGTWGAGTSQARDPIPPEGAPMFTDTTQALRATAMLLNGMADRLDAQFVLHAAHRIAVGHQTPQGFCPSRPAAAWTVTPPRDGRATIDLGANYELLLNEHDSQIQIRNKHNGEVTNIWGDPHIDWNKDGRTDADFWTKTTFMLEDGTKVTIDTEPWK